MANFTKQINAAVSGGVPPYTYAWSFVSGDNTVTCNPANVSNPSFGRSGAYNYNGSAVWKLTVTDAQAQSSEQNVTVRFMPITNLGLLNPIPAPMQFNTSEVTIGSFPINGTATGGVEPYTYLWSRNIAAGSLAAPYTGETVYTNITVKSTLSANNVANPVVSAPVGVGDLFAEKWDLQITDAVGTVFNTSATVLFRKYDLLDVTVPAATNDTTTDASATHEFDKLVVASTTGGIGVHTYAWTCTSNAGVSVSSAFTGEDTSTLQVIFDVTSGTPVVETWSCTVTDAAGNTDTATHTFTLTHTQTGPDPSHFYMQHYDVDRDTNSGHIPEVWVNATMNVPDYNDWLAAYLTPNLLPGKSIDTEGQTDEMRVIAGAYTSKGSPGPGNDHNPFRDSNDVAITTYTVLPNTGTVQFFTFGGIEPITDPIPVTFTVGPSEVSHEQY